MAALSERTNKVFKPKGSDAGTVVVGEVKAGSTPARFYVLDPEIERGAPRPFAVDPNATFGAVYDFLDATCAIAGDRYRLLADGEAIDRGRKCGAVAKGIAMKFGKCRGSPYVLAVRAPTDARAIAAEYNETRHVAAHAFGGVALGDRPNPAWIMNLRSRAPGVAKRTADALATYGGDGFADAEAARRILSDLRRRGLAAALAECVGFSPSAAARHGAVNATVALCGLAPGLGVEFVDGGGAGALRAFAAKANCARYVAEAEDAASRYRCAETLRTFYGNRSPDAVAAYAPRHVGMQRESLALLVSALAFDHARDDARGALLEADGRAVVGVLLDLLEPGLDNAYPNADTLLEATKALCVLANGADHPEDPSAPSRLDARLARTLLRARALERVEACLAGLTATGTDAYVQAFDIPRLLPYGPEAMPDHEELALFFAKRNATPAALVDAYYALALADGDAPCAAGLVVPAATVAALGKLAAGSPYDEVGSYDDDCAAEDIDEHCGFGFETGRPTHSVVEAFYSAAAVLEALGETDAADVDRANRLKAQGNGCMKLDFDDGRHFVFAEGRYLWARRIVAGPIPSRASGRRASGTSGRDLEIRDLTVVLRSNRAEALLRADRPHDARVEAVAALDLDPEHKKSLSRRNRADAALSALGSADPEPSEEAPSDEAICPPASEYTDSILQDEQIGIGKDRLAAIAQTTEVSVRGVYSVPNVVLYKITRVGGSTCTATLLKGTGPPEVEMSRAEVIRHLAIAFEFVPPPEEDRAGLTN